MTSLLKEFSRGGMQADLKTSDGSSAGASDIASKPVEVGFSLMRNTINADGQVTGSDVNDYLERAQDLNAQVESVGFAVETDDGDIIKIYVSIEDADEFEEQLSKLLGLEGDVEEAINQLAQKYDIVDVIWPQDPDGGGENDPDADLSIDDAGDVFAGTDPVEPEGDGSVLPADDDELPAPTDDAPADETPPDGEAPADDAEPKAPADDEGFEDIPAKGEAAADDAPADDAAPADDEEIDIPAAGDSAPADGDAPADDAPADEDEMEPVLDDQGEQKFDKDGEPMMRKKKKKKEPSLDDLPSGDEPIKTEGLNRLARLAEAARDELAAHVAAQQELGDRGKYMIVTTVSGDTRGLRSRPLMREGEIAYFPDEGSARAEAARLTKEKNRAGAHASFRYEPKLVEDKQPQPKEDTMTIGSQFLSRITESKAGPVDKDAVKDGMSIPLDTQQQQLVMTLKRPLEKKLIAFFAMSGVIGRLLKAEPDVEDRVREAADMLRKNAAARNAFNAFYGALATAKGYSPDVPKPAKVEEDKKHSSERKRGASVQQKFEAVMVALGLPEGLVTTSGPSQIGTFVAKTAKLIDMSGDLQLMLNMLANRLGVRGAEAPEDREEAMAAKTAKTGMKTESTIGAAFLARVDEVRVKSIDPFAKDVIALLTALGVPEEHLSYKAQALKMALEAKGKSLKNRATVDQYVERLTSMINSNVKPSAKATGAEEPARTMSKGPAMANEDLLTEAFGELEALTKADLEHLNMMEPASGPCMLANYLGSGAHEETVLAIGVDPDATGRQTLRVGIDGPFDGSMHHKYFTDDEEGYKNALKYANMLRTANLKTGGRPKGWK